MILSLEIRTSLTTPSLNPDCCLLELEGMIVGGDDEEEDEEIGRFRVFFVNEVLAAHEGFPLCDVLDAHSRAHIYGELVDPDEDGLHKGLEKLFKQLIWPRAFLIIDRLEVIEKYRGNGVGHAAMTLLLDHFGITTHYAFLLPKAQTAQSLMGSWTYLKWTAKKKVEWAEKMGMSRFDQDETSGTKKLTAYYRKFGFKKLGRTGLMALNVSDIKGQYQ